MSLPPFSALRAFEAAARLGSFRAAAAELHRTESAVSHQVTNLERWTGRPLFARTGRGLALTDAGAAYAAELTDAIGRLRAATDDLMAANRCTVTVSAPPAVSQHWLLPRLAAFQDAHPDIEVQLHSTVRRVDFRREAIDVALRYLPTAPRDLPAEHLVTERALPVASPGLLARHAPATAPEILAMPRVHNRLHDGEWRRWADACGLADAPAEQVERGTRVDSADAVLRAAAAGLGVGLGRQPMVLDALADGSVVAASDHVLDEGRSYWLVVPPESGRRPHVRAFCDWLRRSLAT
jgi:LysR family glycine cleavage system transcriptional activator